MFTCLSLMSWFEGLLRVENHSVGNKKDVPCLMPKTGAVSAQVSLQITDHKERDWRTEKASKGPEAVKGNLPPSSVLRKK